MESSKQFPKYRDKKPTTGRLWYDGTLLLNGKPFPFLQAEKKRLLATGHYKKDKFKITY